MEDLSNLWPKSNHTIREIRYPEFTVEIKWSKKFFDDYKQLALDYADCGYMLFKNIIESGHDNRKSDMWFLPAIFLMRHSFELGLKALHCRVQKSNPQIQTTFEKKGHNLLELFKLYIEKSENYLLVQEQSWLLSYFTDLTFIDEHSDMFRFPFDDGFLQKYRNKFLDNFAVANNMLQAFLLIKKCLNRGISDPDNYFDNTLPPKFFIFHNHGIGNCYLWHPISDKGFYSKITGYKQSAIFLFYHCSEISITRKTYPLLFLLRNTLELCLKRLFYSGVHIDMNISEYKFHSKRKSHHIKKELWKTIKPVILYCGDTVSIGSQQKNKDVIDIVEAMLFEIDSLDKHGDTFRYPTSYSLEYKLQNQTLDMKNIFECIFSLGRF